MGLLLKLNDKLIAVAAWWHARRMWRRHHLSPAAQQRLGAAKRRTP